MPHIRLQGISDINAKELNTTLIQELSQITGSPEDHFTFELVQTRFFVQGRAVSGNPFIEVLWFKRSQEMQDACAKTITDKIRTYVPDLDITVVFTILPETAYYENGKHF